MPSSHKIRIFCRNLAVVLDFYINELGFRIDVIFPADAPRVVDLSGHGIRVHLEQEGSVRKEEWVTGRAGMEYRDLLPNRMGGQLIASHIRIQNGGPVADYVHHHHVRFQMIYCCRGWVKVVYEDQGPPFVMEAGDCVLQPPHIRHRVLECSDNMEVIEVSSPAEHKTLVDHVMELPTQSVIPDRDFDGQRFVFHQRAKAAWLPGLANGIEARDTGIAAATNGFASVQIVRPAAGHSTMCLAHDAAILLGYVLTGACSLRLAGESSESLSAGGLFVLEDGAAANIVDCSEKTELLCVVV